MSSKLVKFIVVVTLQVLVITGIILYKSAILTGGTPVMLAIEPVDPRDWLRGDYATFAFDISSVGNNYFNYPAINNGDQVYVPLINSYSSNDTWYVGYGISKTKPTKGVFIKGTVASGGTDSATLPPPAYGFTSRQIQINYGIEQYFVPEGVGRNLGFGNERATAKVYVDENGNAVIKQIYINGRPWPQEAVDSNATTIQRVDSNTNARDARRLSDIRQTMTGLELYYNDAGGYPLFLTPGVMLGCGTNNYLIVPANPSPGGMAYGYTPTGTTSISKECGKDLTLYSSYTLRFQLEQASDGFSAGTHTASPAGID